MLETFLSTHLYSALSTCFPMGIFQDHVFKGRRVQSLSFKTCNKHRIKPEQTAQRNLIRYFVLFHLLLILLLNLFVLLIQGVVSRMFHFHRSEQTTTSKRLIRKLQRYFCSLFPSRYLSQTLTFLYFIVFY